MGEFVFVPMGVVILFFVCWMATVVAVYLVGKRHGKEDSRMEIGELKAKIKLLDLVYDAGEDQEDN